MRIRFSDCDPLGHLHNVCYLEYLFDGREEHVATHYPLLRQEMKSRQRNWVTVSTDIRYVLPARWGELVTIESQVLEVSRNSALVEMTMTMTADGALRALLWTRLRYVDLVRGMVTNHPADIQAYLQELVAPVPARSLDERLVQRRLQNVEVQT